MAGFAGTADVAEQKPRAVHVSNGWEIDLTRRELRCGGVPVPLGGRAFEILEVLVRSGGELMSKDRLMEHVWPGAVVEENTLQFHISAIRKALGADRGLLKTVSGRGYRLLGRWDVTEREVTEQAVIEVGQPAGIVERKPGPLFRTNVPIAGSALIGRTASRQHLLDVLSAYRVVTLTGPGGIGKSVLALEVARSAFPTLGGDCWLVELASLSDPALVPAAVAIAMGLRMEGSEISAEAVARTLGGQKFLLVLDNCEHLIDAGARLAEAIVRTCPNASILATSREILRIEGEYAYRVPPLDVPPLDVPPLDVTRLGQDVVCEFSAVQLFNARLMAFGADSSTGPENLALTAAICRRLDGIPLAIEFAAARVATLGLQQTAELLSDRFSLLTAGRRMALPRHRTLRATLDWSYELLSEPERTLLRRSAICAGGFTLEAATAVVGDAGATPLMVAEGISGLVAKSLISLDASARSGRWRLLETVRAYALDKLAESGERERTMRRHAEYYRQLFEQAESEWETRLTAEWLADYAPHIDNLRGALDWSFSPEGDRSIGMALTASAVPLWVHLSLMAECRSRVERAIGSLGAGSGHDTRREMKLYAALATSLIYAGGTAAELEAAWTKTFELAEQLDDTEYRLRAAWDLWTLNRLSRWQRAAITQAEKFCAQDANRTDPNHRLIGLRMLGISYHYLGDQSRARRHLESVLDQHVESENRSHIIRFQVDLRVSAGTFLAPVLWLLGFPDQAKRAAEAAIEDARAANHAMSLCHALVFGACPTALLAGDLASGERYVRLLMDEATRQGLTRWRGYSRGYLGALAIKGGDIAAGLQLVRAGFDELGGFATLRFMDFLMPQALFQAGETAEGLSSVDEAIARSKASEEHRLIAELLRVKGELLLLQRGPDAAPAAEDLFRQALALASPQGALSWELRAATSLAQLLGDQNRSADAVAVLQPVYQRFTEGFDTADLKAAKTLLYALQERGAA